MDRKPLNVHIPILHALNFPSCWLQLKLAGLGRMLLLQHPQPNIPLTPQGITKAHTGMKQCLPHSLPHKMALTVLSARCFNARIACMAEHVSISDVPIYSTKPALCTGWYTLESTAKYTCLVIFWKEKDTTDQTLKWHWKCNHHKSHYWHQQIYSK